MNNYLAKSNPKETIQQHTDNLLKNYDVLLKLYPDIKVSWELLYLACLYHDLGKMNAKFQYKIENQTKVEDEIPHGILSLSFLNTENLKSKGYTMQDIQILANAIAYHHERDLDYSKYLLKEEVDKLKEEAKGFEYNKINCIKVEKLKKKYFRKNRIYEDDNEEKFYESIVLKGLLNRLDYAASGFIEVERKNDFLIKSLKSLMNEWKEKRPESKWNELQEYMINNSESNIITIAETGMGKTEAGLLWIGNNKGFFTLPLKTALNAMYQRISKGIIKSEIENRIGLLHSDTLSEYINRDDGENTLDEYYNKTKQLSLPLTICTLDQLFDFVFRYRGFESKLATLSYSKVVIDEVQMYSPDLISYLVVGLSYISKLGGKFAILTATLPPVVVDLLKQEGIEFIEPKTFTNNSRIRHSVNVIHKQLNSIEKILELYKDNKVLVICNTVKQAQKLYNELLNEKTIDNINLFHSSFIKKHRKKKEEQILEVGNRHSNIKGVWITTQVVEASLDIDFDILITELSDLNGLFQRFGRCYRGRELLVNDYNCYVFDGGEKECSGVGYVIDREIYNLSKKAMSDWNGPMKEIDKMNMVSKLYTKEKIKETDYYKMIKKNIDSVTSIIEFELSKNEAKKAFRKIESVTIIPEKIYNENKNYIENILVMLTEKQRSNLPDEERKKKLRQKIKARIKLMELTMSIPLYQYNMNKEHVLKNIEINKYTFIPVLSCYYTFETGIEYKGKKEKNIEDRFF